jgi:DNA ligase D-like protein (predicted 3'-phosphoesterase)
MTQKLYVIHEHHATHLHWDLRLERDGVLKSWAVPKEPPTESGIKRLAVQVDDHALAYAKFKGTIPEGQYGAGEVKIWDSGTYEPIEWTDKRIVVNIHGKKLKGEFCLLKFRPPKNWLFFKKK